MHPIIKPALLASQHIVSSPRLKNQTTFSHFRKFICLYIFLPDTGIIMTIVTFYLLLYSCLSIYEDERLSQHWTTQLSHTLTSGVQDSKHACVPFQTRGKLTCLDKERKNIPREHVLCITLNSINCVVKLHSSTLTFCKVVQQRIWG